MSLPFVRLSTVGSDFDLLDGHEDGQNSEEILEEKLRQIQLSTLKAKKRLRKNFDNVKRHQKVSLPPTLILENSSRNFSEISVFQGVKTRPFFIFNFQGMSQGIS